MVEHIKWTEIDNFHSLRRQFEKYPQLLGESSTVTYRAKVKLHGTNAGVRIDPDGTVTALSRTSVITPDNDNAGFARWVASREANFARLARNFTIVVFGEWCGPGIQKGVAVSQIPSKVFAVFGMRVPEIDAIASTPNFLESLVEGIPDVHVIPWFGGGEEYTVDWLADGEFLQPVVDVINTRVTEVEEKDPWVSAKFGVDGVGEGLVLYPVGRGDSYKVFSDLVFKAKGEKHNTVAKTKPAQVSATSVEALAEFVDLVVTAPRLEQGAAHAALHGSGQPYNVRDMGTFLKWINDDLVKETAAEVEASNLPPKEAYKACVNHARVWFQNQSKKL
jgi:RNA ligase